MPVLWIINHYVSLPPSPGGIRHLSLARQLGRLGWDVFLVCATSEGEPGGVRAGARPPRHLVELDGFHVLTVRVPSYDGNGPRRIANMAAFGAAAALPHVTSGLPRPDVVMGCSVHPLAAWAGARQAKRLRVPFVFETRDLWPETFVSLGRMERTSRTARALYALEAALWTQASMVISPLGQVPAYEHEQGLPVRPFLHIPNGVHAADFDPAPATHDGPLKLGYFGSHGNTDYLDTILEALATPEVRRRATEFSVHLYGWGPHKPRLQEKAQRLDLANLRFHDPVARDPLPAVMHEMDAFLFPLGDSQGLYRYGASPNKLPDYMAAGRPILMNAPFEGDPVTASGGGGIVVPECTPSAWGDAFLTLIDTPAPERAAMGARLRRLAEAEYDFEVLGAALDRGLRSVVGR